MVENTQRKIDLAECLQPTVLKTSFGKLTLSPLDKHCSQLQLTLVSSAAVYSETISIADVVNVPKMLKQKKPLQFINCLSLLFIKLRVQEAQKEALLQVNVCEDEGWTKIVIGKDKISKRRFKQGDGFVWLKVLQGQEMLIVLPKLINKPHNIMLQQDLNKQKQIADNVEKIKAIFYSCQKQVQQLLK